MLVGVLIAIVYTLGSIVDLYLETIGGVSGGFDITSGLPGILGRDWFSWELFVVAPLWLIVILICVIAIWIGYSMLTINWYYIIDEQHACTRSIGGTRGRISC